MTEPGSAHDISQTAAWSGLVQYLLTRPDAVQQFVTDTGLRAAVKPRTLDEAIATMGRGYDTDEASERFAAAWVRWATKTHWGEEEVTPTIRGILDALPETEQQ